MLYGVGLSERLFALSPVNVQKQQCTRPCFIVLLKVVLDQRGYLLEDLGDLYNVIQKT